MAALTDDRHAAAAWARALDLWGVAFHPPQPGDGRPVGSFAWFSHPPEVHVDLPMLRRMHLDPHLESVLAHELGHHVLAPGTRLDGLKIRHRCAQALVANGAPPATAAAIAPELANLWADALVNDRVVELQRNRDPDRVPDMVAIWQGLTRRPTTDRLWWVLRRADELLWRLPDGALCSRIPPAPPPARRTERGDGASVTELEDELAGLSGGDPAVAAERFADAVRTFGGDAVSGALGAAMILAPFRLERRPGAAPGARPADAATGAACAGDPTAAPADAGEVAQVLSDPRVTGPGASAGVGDPAAQGYGLAETLALFPGSDAAAVAAAWYEAAARPHLLPVVEPSRRSRSGEEVPGPLTEWLPGDPPAAIDWPATLARGPVVVPGLTTLARTVVGEEQPEPAEPIELELYIDSSGSMRAPGSGSPAALAGAVLVLSVLRSGGRARVTSFSGPGQVAGEGPTHDRRAALAALLTYFGGGTTFPLDLLEERGRRAPAAERHLVVLSDDGLLSMFGQGQPGREQVAARARDRFATATLVLVDGARSVDARARAAGYDVQYLRTMEEAPAVCAALAARIGGRSRG